MPGARGLLSQVSFNTAQGTAVSNRIKILAALIFYAGIFYFVIKPLWLEPLRHQHVRATYDTSGGYVPRPLAANESGEHKLFLTARNGLDLRHLETIDLLIATYVQTLKVHQIEIRATRGDCRFISDARKIHDNEYLHFKRLKCDVESLAAGESLQLFIQTQDLGKNIALWSTRSPNRYEPANTQDLVIHATDGDYYPVGGLGFEFQPTFRDRAAMIEQVWSPAIPPHVLECLVAVLMALPLLLVRRHISPPIAACFTFVLAMMLMTLFTLIAPPLQAPDEATHFWNFVHIDGKDHLKDQILKDINRSHYERVFCHDLEKLDSADLAESLNAPWPEHGFLLDLSARSFAGHKMWQAYNLVIGDGHALRVLLLARSLNAALIATLLAVGTYLLATTFGAYYGFTALLSVMMMPTFWFFATHLSNHTFIICGYIALMMLSLMVLRSNAKLGRAVWPMMSVVLLSLLAGRASMLTMVIGTALLYLAALFGRRGLRYNFLQVIFWPICAGLIILLLRDTPYFAFTLGQVGQHADTFGLMIWAIPLLLLLSLVICRAGLIRLNAHGRTDRWLTKSVLILLASGVIAILLLPGIRQFNLPNIEFSPAPEKWQYVKLAIYTLITNLGVGGNDFLVIRTLWGGFGCPDNFLSQGFVDLLKIVMVGGIFLALACPLLKGRFADFLKVSAILSLSLIYYVLLAIACWKTGSTLHGRYILGFAMLLLAVAMHGYHEFSRWISRKWSVSADGLTLLWLGIATQVAFATLSELMTRYYA